MFALVNKLRQIMQSTVIMASQPMSLQYVILQSYINSLEREWYYKIKIG